MPWKSAGETAVCRDFSGVSVSGSGWVVLGKRASGGRISVQAMLGACRWPLTLLGEVGDEVLFAVGSRVLPLREFRRGLRNVAAGTLPELGFPLLDEHRRRVSQCAVRHCPDR
jgi:hypothetical protein